MTAAPRARAQTEARACAKQGGGTAHAPRGGAASRVGLPCPPQPAPVQQVEPAYQQVVVPVAGSARAVQGEAARAASWCWTRVHQHRATMEGAVRARCPASGGRASARRAGRATRARSRHASQRARRQPRAAPTRCVRPHRRAACVPPRRTAPHAAVLNVSW